MYTLWILELSSKPCKPNGATTVLLWYLDKESYFNETSEQFATKARRYLMREDV